MQIYPTDIHSENSIQELFSDKKLNQSQQDKFTVRLYYIVCTDTSKEGTVFTLKNLQFKLRDKVLGTGNWCQNSDGIYQ